MSGNNISDKVVKELSDKLVNLTEFDLLDNDVNNENGKKQLVERATQTLEIGNPTSIFSNDCSKGVKKEPSLGDITGQPATVSDGKHSKTSSNIGCKPNDNHVPVPALK